MNSENPIEMFEPQAESDEDCEVYFLKPVNEYNIVEKIKAANKELFNDNDVDAVKFQCTFNLEANATKMIDHNATSTTTTASSTATPTKTGVTTTTLITTTSTTMVRKVTFAPHLEDYEPQSPTSELETNSVAVSDLKRNPKNCIEKFPTIVEEEQTIASAQKILPNDENVQNSTDINVVETVTETALELVNVNNVVQEEINKNTLPADVDVDEICEEIIVMEMDSTMSTTANKLKYTQEQQRRVMVKQPTFDYDEQDNKSLTNLLTASDCEEDNIATDDSEDGNDDSIFMGIDDFDEDDDEDRLSLIVASYLPHDFERIVAMTPSPSPSTSATMSASANTKLIDKSDQRCTYPRRCSGNTNTTNKDNHTTSTFSFSKRFHHLRRKAHSTNSISDSNGSHASKQTNSKADLNELKLNYKTCCEYRNSIQGRLPKYTGYLSEYGLSRDQLQEREQQLQKKQRFVLEKTLRANEQEMRKMKDNERAFTTWLRNKMRFPINKTRNMFDVQLNFKGRTKTKTTTTVKADATTTVTKAKNSNFSRPFGCATKN